MAIVPGEKRKSATTKRVERATGALRRSREQTDRYFRQRMCNQCDPHQWIRNRDWTDHRENFHRPGGYQYELRKRQMAQRVEAVKAAETAAKEAAKVPARPAQRPKSKSKPTATKGRPAVATTTTDGKAWKSKISTRKESENGESGNQATGATTSMTESIVESFRSWSIHTPPSIPASRVDAQAAADMWRGIADALRMRARMSQENDNIPAKITEPLEAAAQVASQIGDQHMEVVRRLQTHYGEVAEILSRPDTPNADFLKGGK